MGSEKTSVKKHIFCSVTGLYRFINQLDHDIRSFALRHDSSLSCKGPPVVFLYLSHYVFFFRGSQQGGVGWDEETSVGQPTQMFVNDLLREQCSETKLVGMGTAEETVVRILGEFLLEASCFLLHVHTPVVENVAESVGEQLHDKNAFLLLAVAFLQKGADLEITENSQKILRSNWKFPVCCQLQIVQ